MSYFTLERSGQQPRLVLSGPWRMEHLPEILNEIRQHPHERLQSGVVEGSQLDGIDTAGAQLLFQHLLKSPFDPSVYSFSGFVPESQAILDLVAWHFGAATPLREPDTLGFLGHVGRGATKVGELLHVMLGFSGEAFVESVRAVIAPRQMRWKEFIAQTESAGLDAIPIVMLVNFLIGIVIAYLFGLQIERYGANILIVNAVSIATCRELSPILVAILVAGRSGSAFTAQIGTMKLNEEVDAMQVLGLSPMRVLVIPRVFALMLTMPLLVFLGDIAGIFGSMCIADLRLGVTWATFLQRLQSVLPVRSFFVGLLKSPVYAIVIAMIGCHMGFSVENNARSVGSHTTSTVVQSIVAVILLNAAFAVLFVELKI